MKTLVFKTLKVLCHSLMEQDENFAFDLAFFK